MTVLTRRKPRKSGQKVAVQFYRIGHYYRDFVAEWEALGFSADDFPHLSSESIRFTFGEADLPYPVAVLREYQIQKEEVCKTHRERLALMDSTSPVYQRAYTLVENYCL